MKTLTQKQIKDLVKAQGLIKKALAIIEPIEDNSDLKYSMNRLLSSQTQGLIFSIDDEIKSLS